MLFSINKYNFYFPRKNKIIFQSDDQISGLTCCHKLLLVMNVWSFCIILQENAPFPKEIKNAQFYYMDRFLILTSSNTLYMYKYHLDPTKQDIKRSVCNQLFPWIVNLCTKVPSNSNIWGHFCICNTCTYNSLFTSFFYFYI